MIRLIVGLGNPGQSYAQTRHNVGFWWCDRAAYQYGVVARLSPRFQALVGGSQTAAHSLHWLWPQTYMNHSGRSIFPYAQFYKISIEQILIVHDELALPPGCVRLKQGGGHGGHNGLKDIIQHFGGPGFWRLRLGIGHPGDRSKVVDFVLNAPAVDECADIERAMGASLAVLEDLLQGQTAAAMLKLHTEDDKRRPLGGPLEPFSSG